MSDAQASAALFISKSVANRQVFPENAAFTQTVVLKNIGPDAWNGCTLVRLAVYGVSGKQTDALGAPASVAVPATAPGATATVAIPCKAVKSNPKSGAAQASPWALRKADGTKIVVYTAPGTPSKGGAVWTAVSISPAPATGMPDLSKPGYADSAANLYVKIGNGGQCTAFVYGRVKEKLNIALETVPGSAFACNAAGQKWIDQLTGPGKPYQFGKTPRPDAIAVWTLNADANNGHVAYVENVDGAGNVFLNEANGASYASFAADNGPDSDTWGGGYDGRLKNVAPAAMNGHLGPQQSLKGYIYLR